MLAPVGSTRRAQGLRAQRHHSLHECRVNGAAPDDDCAGLRPVARIPTLHRNAALLPLLCNIAWPSFARAFGAQQGGSMDIVALVMLGSIALWLSQQFDSWLG
jgi:hypothetical protein